VAVVVAVAVRWLTPQGLAHLAELGAELAVLTNFERSLLSAGPGADPSPGQIQISQPVFYHTRPEPACITASAVGLLTGITVRALEQYGYAPGLKSP
jgi:hypothetical protein